MSDRSPHNSRAKYSRREFIRRSAAATALLGLGAAASEKFLGSAFAEDAYAGDLVLASQQGATPDKALPNLLDAFKAANPSINPKTVLYPEEKFVALYTAAQAAGEQIDVLMLNGQDLRRYATSGGLIPFDDVPFKNRFIPEALGPFTVDGHLWGVPSGAAGGFPIYVNLALLKKYQLSLPQTYDDLKQIAKVLAEQEIKAFTHPGKVIYMWPVWFFTTFAQSSGNKPLERTTEILTGKGKFTDRMSSRRSISSISSHATNSLRRACSVSTSRMRSVNSLRENAPSIFSMIRLRNRSWRRTPRTWN